MKEIHIKLRLLISLWMASICKYIYIAPHIEMTAITQINKITLHGRPDL